MPTVRLRFLGPEAMRGYDLHPNGRRFLVRVLAEREPTPPITRLHVVHNWFTELERLSPTGPVGGDRGGRHHDDTRPSWRKM